MTGVGIELSQTKVWTAKKLGRVPNPIIKFGNTSPPGSFVSRASPDKVVPIP